MFALRYLVAIACLLTGVTASGDPLDALATKSSLSGTFTQSIVSPEGLLLEQAEGRFQLLRPDYFLVADTGAGSTTTGCRRWPVDAD